MEFIAAMIALSTLGLTMLFALASVAYTVFWVWMLLDSIVRDTSDYPAGTGIDKLVWVLLNAFLQPAFVLYYVFVYRKAAERASSQHGTHTTSSAA